MKKFLSFLLVICMLSTCIMSFTAMAAPITSSTITVASRDVVLVLDVSGSMSGSRLENTKTAAKRFVDQILDNSHNTQIAIVTYDSYVYTALELTKDKNLLKNTIDSLRLGGSTNMYAGLETAGNILNSSAADKKAIVIMTDGAANIGTYGTSGDIKVAEGYDVYFTSYGSAIYNLAQNYINNRGYKIYSLGFDLYENSAEYNLIKHIASFNSQNVRECWFVTNENINNIVFTYVDIASAVATRKTITIAIECPVEASVTFNGEVLDKNNTKTSFGTVTVTPVEDGNSYLFTLEDNEGYLIDVVGIDDGTMDFTITYTDGDMVDNKVFKDIKISKTTKITATANNARSTFSLEIDNNGDGAVDETIVQAPSVDLTGISVRAKLAARYRYAVMLRNSLFSISII